MKFKRFITLLIILSPILSKELLPLEIIEKSTNRLNYQDISFTCNIKLQSLSKDPSKLSFKFYSYWSDSSNYYGYLKFKSPIDYKDTEIWSHYSNEVQIKKRMPINNKIMDVEDSFEGIDIINFLNFKDLYKEIQNDELSVNKIKFKDKDVYLVESYKKRNKKKSIKFYIDKNTFFIYKIEWNNKRGAISKILTFNDQKIINNQNFPSIIIYEDIKKGLKTTCKLNKISFDSISKETLDLIKLGFNDE
jgi:hypothetical protein